ncbi:MAG: N-acetyltransferase [Bacteroidales bacterium]|nr:N-acetyltransferase [Bacteroidales bacterium]
MTSTSSVKIVPVETKKQLRQFINFSLDLYKDNPYYVPELAMDTKASLTTNPALSFCQCQPFLAYKDGKVAGRVVALINPRANATWKTNDVRFNWIDFIEDYEVCKALLDAVVAWGKERGMDGLEGPIGFIDYDREGCLVEGFDKMSTMSLAFCYPYYSRYFDRYGLEKSVDWVEYRITMPEETERFTRLAEVVAKRYDLHLKIFKNNHDLLKNGAKDIFKLLNGCYAKLYGFSQLDDAQVDNLIKNYIPFVDVNLLPTIYDKDGNMVGCAIMIPSLAKAIQKTRGKLFPFGWWHLVKALYLKYDDTIEFLLVGVSPEFRGKGLNALMVSSVFPYAKKKGFKYCETNANLETNHSIQALWKSFDHELVKRRRAYIKHI